MAVRKPVREFVVRAHGKAVTMIRPAFHTFEPPKRDRPPREEHLARGEGVILHFEGTPEISSAKGGKMIHINGVNIYISSVTEHFLTGTGMKLVPEHEVEDAISKIAGVGSLSGIMKHINI